MSATTIVGVLALQGAFLEHLVLLRKAAAILSRGGAAKPNPGEPHHPAFEFLEVRTSEQLSRCDALIIPGGESTTLAFVATQTKLMEPLRRFVKVEHKPTWGTCAGLILLAEEATGAKKGGQELVGGLHIRAHRNHFGRQVHSFQSDLRLPFLQEVESSISGRNGKDSSLYPGVFIRAPVVEKILPAAPDSTDEATNKKASDIPNVEVLGTVSRGSEEDDIIAVRQGNIFATSFHPELTDDARIHLWWLHQVLKAKQAS